MEITLAEITRWANSNELDAHLGQLQEEDPESFEHFILAACDDQSLLEFAKKRSSA